jgi:MoaA/NifB/PqqE/SkfB family radical SAM enzyme
MCRKDIVIDKLETEIYYKVLNKCRNLSLDILEFTTAGEPFLYKDRLLEFLETLTTKDTKQVNFITNGTLLDKEYIDKLEQIKIKNGINISICVSIDSINEAGYKIVRGGDFNKVIENTEYLNSKKLLDRVICTISLPVLFQVPNVKEFWHKKGINVDIHLAKPINIGGNYPLTIKEYEFCKKSDIWVKSGIENID